MLSDTASKEMLDAMASVGKHYDQVYCKLLSRSHDIDIRRTRSDLDHILHFILKSSADYSGELGPGFFFPARIGIKRQRNVHVMGRYPGYMKDIERGVAFPCQRTRQK